MIIPSKSSGSAIMCNFNRKFAHRICRPIRLTMYLIGRQAKRMPHPKEHALMRLEQMTVDVAMSWPHASGSSSAKVKWSRCCGSYARSPHPRAVPFARVQSTHPTASSRNLRWAAIAQACRVVHERLSGSQLEDPQRENQTGSPAPRSATVA